MADGVTFQSSTLATPPANTEIATDDAGSDGHVQIVKLAVSTNGAATPLTADNTDGLLVNLGGNNDVTVTGSVTANAGTNLNTASLALESGGNLAAAATSLAVMDDWDESDRAKVNPIVGQAGVAAGAGAVGATVQRVTLASDDPAVSALQTLDNAISGSEMQVDVVGALPAGTNAIGKLAANSGVDIGDVDVTSVVPGTGATNLGKAEDAAHSSGDVGVMALAVRSDAGSAFGADGDYVPLSVDSSGAVRVTGGGGGTQYTEGDTDASITGTAMLWEDGSDTLRSVSAAKPLPVEIIAGAGSGGTAMTDDAAFTPGTTSITPIGAMFDDVTPDSVNEGDGGVVRMSANRNLYGTIRDAAGNERGANVDASNRLSVSVDNTVTVASHAVTNAGTFATQVDGAALTALQLIDDTVFADDAAFTPGTSKVSAMGAMADESSPDSVDEGDVGIPRMTLDRKLYSVAGGDVAHDGADSGNPVKQGAKAVAHGANPTAVAAADRTDLYANRHGVQFTIGGHPNAKSATYLATGSGTDDNVLPAISSGTKYAITRITITLDEATTVGVAVRLGFGTANVPALPSAAADAVDDILVYHPGLVPGGGITIGDGSGILGVGGDGAELRITNEAPTSGTLVVTVTYFTIES